MATTTAPVTRAKFTIRYVETVRQPDGTKYGERIHAHAVYGAGNESWSDATPSGELSIFITNPNLFDALPQGKDFYLDFIPVGD